MRRIFITFSAMVCCLLAPTVALADNRVYTKAAPSTVWFFERGSASGVLIDVNKKLVLTAEHVVRSFSRDGKKDVKIMFAQTDKDNHVLVDIEQYGFAKKKTLAIPGKVVYANRLQDIALVELTDLPPNVIAVPLAKTLPRPGDNVHVIGNSTFNRGGLFSYSTGCVRNSYFFKQVPEFDRNRGGKLFLTPCNFFYSLAHHAPTNRGDSGGPVLNDKGELVSIISQGTTGSGEGEQVIDQSVHLLELRKALEPVNWPIIKEVEFQGTMFLTDPDPGSPPFVPYQFNNFFLPVEAGNKVDLYLKGNGKTDLDLFTLDFDASKVTVSETGLTDREKGNFTPEWSGMAQVKVRNLFMQGQGKKGQIQTPRNTYTLRISCQKPVQGPFCCAGFLAAQATDTLKISFDKSQANARIEVRGDGDTQLHLKVEDPSGQVVSGAKRIAGLPDRISIAFTVAVAGVYTVTVQNADKQTYNAYVLRID